MDENISGSTMENIHHDEAEDKSLPYNDHGDSHATYFHTDTKLTVLLECLKVDSVLGIVFVAVVFVIITMCYEGIRCMRLLLAEKHHYGRKQITMTSIPHLIQTSLFFGEIIFTYAIMLMVMTFNVWMLVAVATGSAIGFQLCRLLSSSHKNLLAEKVRSLKPAEDCGNMEDPNATESNPRKCRKDIKTGSVNSNGNDGICATSEEIVSLVATV